MAEKKIRLQIRGSERITDSSILLKDEPGYKDGKLKIGDGQSPWKDLPGISGDGGEINLKNGESQYSIISIEDEDRKNQTFGRANAALGRRGKTYQRASFTFGDDNKSGRTKQEFNNYYWDSTDDSEIFEDSIGKLKGVTSALGLLKFDIVTKDTTMYIVGLKNGTDRRLNGSYGLMVINASLLALQYADELKQMGIDPNSISGYYAFVTDNNGSMYEFSFGSAFTAGISNKTLGRASLTGGEGNYSEGSHSFVFGRGIKNLGNYSVILGGENGYEGETKPNITNDGNSNFIFGTDIRTNGYSRNILLGRTLAAVNDECVIVGKNSGGKNNPELTLRFAVGTGADPEHGFNGLEVYEGGIVRVQRAPTYDTEVARLKEINDLDKKINTKIDTLHANGFIVIGELPTASKDTLGKIYLVAKNNPDDANNDIFDEYITAISGSNPIVYYWERIGSTKFTAISNYEDLYNVPITVTTWNKLISGPILEGYYMFTDVPFNTTVPVQKGKIYYYDSSNFIDLLNNNNSSNNVHKNMVLCYPNSPGEQPSGLMSVFYKNDGYLMNGTYAIEIQNLIRSLNIRVVEDYNVSWGESLGNYRLVCDNSIIDGFNEMNLTAYYNGDVRPVKIMNVGHSIQIGDPVYEAYAVAWLVSLSPVERGTFEACPDPSVSIDVRDHIIEFNSWKELTKKYVLHSDGSSLTESDFQPIEYGSGYCMRVALNGSSIDMVAGIGQYIKYANNEVEFRPDTSDKQISLIDLLTRIETLEKKQ